MTEHDDEQRQARFSDLSDAIQLFLEHRASGGDDEAFLSANEDKRDILAPMLEGPNTVPLPDVTTVGDFRLIREIGRGGMGVVYEARQQSLDRTVAIKLLPAERTADPGRLARFYREAEAGGRLHHPGIVTVYAVGEANGTHFIVQELVAGSRTLSDAIDEWRIVREPTFLHYRRIGELFVQIAQALAFAHKAGVVHRDIKPSNILLTPEGTPKVADFGLARLAHGVSLSRTGNLVGSPHYMSPERLEGHTEGRDATTDIFSLGVTLYETLTLVRPFEGDSSPQVFRRILQEDPVDPRRIRPTIPHDLAILCLKALEKRPGHRFASMDEFAAELQRHVTDVPILARPLGPGPRLSRWVRRRPGPSLAIGTALVALVLITTVWGRAVEARSALDGELARDLMIEGLMGEFLDAPASGMGLATTGNRRGAIAVLREGLARDSNLAAARLHVGVLLGELGDHSEAVENLKPLLGESAWRQVAQWVDDHTKHQERRWIGPPADWDAGSASPSERFYAGRFFLRTAQRAKALDTLRPLQAHPDYAVPAMYLMGIGHSTRQYRDYAESLRWYTAAWTLAPENAAVANNLAAILIEAGTAFGARGQFASYLEDALHVTMTVASSNPEHAPFWKTHAEVLARQPVVDEPLLEHARRRHAELSRAPGDSSAPGGE